MAKKNSSLPVKMDAADIVLACVNAINQEDFEEARKYAHEDMTFQGVLGSRNGSEEYFSDMKKMKLKYDIIKAFQQDEDVCLLYNLDMSGITIFGCGWYRVTNGKINSLRVVFDPRPLLEKNS